MSGVIALLHPRCTPERDPPVARRASSSNLVKLTKVTVAALALEPGQGERVVWDSETPGLGLRVRTSGNKVWVIRPPRMGGASRIFTLGSASVLSLTEARTAARDRMAKAQLGDDPHAARRESRAQAAVTVGVLAERYIASAETRLGASTVYNMKNHLNRHFKSLHSYPVNGVQRADVAAQLGIITKENGPHAANRARAVLSGFFSWAIGEGLADLNPTVGTNKATADVPRDRVLSKTELASIWRACGDNDFGRIIRLLILTGLRRDEVAGMEWGEVDIAGGLWTLPAARMKNRRAHDVPLSAPALEILAGMAEVEGRDLAFGRGTGPFSGFSRAKVALDTRTGITVPWVLHDLRRTTATGMADLGVLPHVVEAVLSHVSGYKAGVAGVYNRASYASEKRDALDRWASYIVTLTEAS